MEQAFLQLRYVDHGGEKAKVTVRVPVWTAANFDAQEIFRATLVGAFSWVSLGQQYHNERLDRNIRRRARPWDENAQRELAWRVTYTDNVTHKRGRFDIPTANPTLLEDGTDYMDMGLDPAIALVSAVEAYCVSLAGNPVTVLDVRLVGRAYLSRREDRKTDTTRAVNLLVHAAFNGTGTLTNYEIEPRNYTGSEFVRNTGAWDRAGGEIESNHTVSVIELDLGHDEHLSDMDVTIVAEPFRYWPRYVDAENLVEWIITSAVVQLWQEVGGGGRVMLASWTRSTPYGEPHRISFMNTDSWVGCLIDEGPYMAYSTSAHNTTENLLWRAYGVGTVIRDLRVYIP